MITIRKLASLKPSTRLRKIVSLLGGIEMDLDAGRETDRSYLHGLSRLLIDDEGLPVSVRGPARDLGSEEVSDRTRRLCNAVRHALLAHLGAEPAEWDLLLPSREGLDRSRGRLFPLTLYLDDVRSPFNVGSILRCAEAFGVERVLVSEATPPPTHPRAMRASMGCWQVVPWEVATEEVVAEEEDLVALETGGTPIEEFAFPPRGTLVVGSEELGVSPRLLQAAERGRGRVSIPLFGAKASLNVAQALGIVLYRWTLALSRAS